MNLKQIETIGHFLTYYRSDLHYINQFASYKEGTITVSEYISKTKGSFYSFLIEFRIVRNFAGGQVEKLLEETANFINKSDCTDVDGFALHLSQTNLTRNSIMASMASKILFLNNPYEIIPMDALARRSLRQSKNIYNAYRENLYNYKLQYRTEIMEMLEYVKPLTDIVHQEFPLITDIHRIAENRMIDKILWTSGKR